MDEITIRECTTIEEFDGCVYLQREAFGLPDLELSPRRHLIVSRAAGGWTLGAFVAERMVGFVHHLAAVRANNEIFGYSHVMAVAKDYQNKGVGARLKWAQRERALGVGSDDGAQRALQSESTRRDRRNLRGQLLRNGLQPGPGDRVAKRSVVGDVAPGLCARARACLGVNGGDHRQ